MVNYAAIIKLLPVLSIIILYHFQKKYLSMTQNKSPNVSCIYEVFKQPFPNIKLTPITTKEIKDIIKSLQWKNSQGYNEILLKILKINMPFIVSPLTHMFNKVLSSSIFPMHLTYSQISPIFKKGCMTEMWNYRPISLPTSFSKVLER